MDNVKINLSVHRKFYLDLIKYRLYIFGEILQLMKGFLGAFLVFTLWAVGSIYYLHLKQDTSISEAKNAISQDLPEIEKDSQTQTNKDTAIRDAKGTVAAIDTLENRLSINAKEGFGVKDTIAKTNTSPAKAITDAQLLADEMKKSIAISDTIDIDTNEPEQTLNTSIYVADGPSVSTRIFYPVYNNADLILDKEIVAYASEIKELLKKHPEKKVTIIGHTDNIGNSEDNFRIALRKSRQVKWYLTARRGIPRKFITATSRGEEEPIESNNSAWGRKKNNRIEIIID